MTEAWTLTGESMNTGTSPSKDAASSDRGSARLLPGEPDQDLAETSRSTYPSSLLQGRL